MIVADSLVAISIPMVRVPLSMYLIQDIGKIFSENLNKTVFYGYVNSFTEAVRSG